MMSGNRAAFQYLTNQRAKEKIQKRGIIILKKYAQNTQKNVIKKEKV